MADTVGATYVAGDSDTALEEQDVFLCDHVLVCVDNPVYIGTPGNVSIPLAVGQAIGIAGLNLRQLRIKNQVAGQNGSVILLGVLCE